MIAVIKELIDLCVGCSRCVRECLMETANITYQDESGNIKVKIDHEKCITCGVCVSACKHEARTFTDDTERFFNDLSKGKPISIMAAPSIKTNLPDYKKLFTFLKNLGVNKIYDVSLGTDICVWAHVKLIKEGENSNRNSIGISDGVLPMITQSCPAIVNYCEFYRHDLLKRLSPIHSPMACTSIYMKKYQGINDSIAALSPCMAKANEFESTKLAEYNITFKKLLEYIKKNNISLPEKETEYDHGESGLGSLFPMPGGFKENIEYFMGKNLHVAKAEGFNVYEKLNKYAETPQEFLPDIYDVLNCAEGCNIGTASLHNRCLFEIEKTIKNTEKKMMDERKKEHYQSVYNVYDNTLNLANFKRKYSAVPANSPQLTNTDIGKAFEILGKTSYEKQHIDCLACGSKTCYDMAKKIALNINIPNNCIVKAMEDAKIEHKENLAANAQLTEMEKAHESDERMRVMLDSMPFAAHFWDENINMTDCNQAAADMFNIKDKQEYIRRCFEFLPEYQIDGTKSYDLAKNLIRKTFETGFEKVELMSLAADGELIPIEDTYVRVNYKGKKMVVGYSVDLREQKKMMQELKSSALENQHQIIRTNLAMKAGNVFMWEVELKPHDPLNFSNPTYWPDGLRHILGYKDETDFPNLAGSLLSRLHPDDANVVPDNYFPHLLDKTGQTPYNVEYRLQKKNGEYVHIHATSETIRDKDGNPLRSVGTIIDITAAKNLLNEAEKQRMEAENANKAKSEFLSHISHEIRTPMNAVLGTAEIQLQKETNTPDTEEAFNTIYNSGNLLLNIINDMLDLSKIEAGKLELIPTQYDIPSIIYDTVQLNLLRYESKPLEFNLHIDNNTPHDIIGDELRIKQILNNILSNAFKYTEEGEVKLSISAEFEHESHTNFVLVLQISDTGQGMTKEQVFKLFEEYTRFNMETNRTIVGTGLGMHITKRLVDVMNGNIFVESELDKGTVFTVRLPQERVGTNVCGNELADKLRNSRLKSMLKLNKAQIVREYMPYGRVLVVDDVESNLYVAKGMLLPYGLKIETVNSGFEAVDKIKNGNVYDIIFMDHMMPKMDGIETTQKIRDMGYTNSIVALTANAVAGASAMFLNNGFDGFISKPIDTRELNSSLNHMIRDKHPPEVVEAARQQKPVAWIVPNMQFKSDILKVSVLDIEKALVVLEDLLPKINDTDTVDINLFTTTVHGMKSVLLNIGEAELSAAALRLEQAGSAGRITEISTDITSFMNALRSTIEKHKPKAIDNVNNISHDDIIVLKERLSEIKTACERVQKRAAKTALTDLRSKTWPHKINALLYEISMNLLHGEYKKIISAVEETINEQLD